MNLQSYINKYGNVEIEEKQLNELLGIKESKVWKPKHGEKYWMIDNVGGSASITWFNDDIDNLRWKFGNVFKSQEEAQFVVEKHKVEVELQRYADEHNECEIDWEDEDQAKYCICFDNKFKKLDTNCNYVSQENNICFTSREIAKQAIQAIGEDKIKKYYFGMED